MGLTREVIAEVSVAVRAAVSYLDEEKRWALLQKWLVKEAVGERKAGRRSLRLETLRSIVCPRVTDREGKNVLREQGPAHWTSELRVANAFACRRRKPALLETRR